MQNYTAWGERVLLFFCQEIEVFRNIMKLCETLWNFEKTVLKLSLKLQVIFKKLKFPIPRPLAPHPPPCLK